MSSARERFESSIGQLDRSVKLRLSTLALLIDRSVIPQYLKEALITQTIEKLTGDVESVALQKEFNTYMETCDTEEMLGG